MEPKLYEYANPRLIDDMRDQPNQTLQSMSGYAQEPLLPLEEACEPLKDIIPRMGAHISIAMQASRNPTDGLTQDESAAICLYTMEWDDGTTEPYNSLYAHLNQTLKQPDRTKLRPWFRYLKLLLTALAKLPSVSHEMIWCSVCQDISADYSPGTESTW